MDLICYLSNGYPTLERSVEIAKDYVKGGCDIIEIDFPSRDPFLEGEYIASRMAKALEVCDDYDVYMNEMIKVKELLPSTSFILLAYENTIEEIGVEKFTSFCTDNGFVDIILCGIKDDVIKNHLIAHGLKISCYVQRAMEQSEVDYAMSSNGFVYLQAKSDTHYRNFPTLSSCIEYLRGKGITRPIYCGVGIHTLEDVKMAKEAGSDAVFIGSTILKLQDNPTKLIQTIKDFKSHC